MDTPTDMQRLLVAYEAARIAPNDPESTTLLSLTAEEISLTTLGLTLIRGMFSEMAPMILPFVQKIAQAGAAQGNVEFTDEQWRRLGLEPLPPE